jgi:NADH:ubiquinone oxidoreductase subunit 5 (subunit L)/multisubunit Na+/H+ antiporter MnhA subunit
MPRNRGDHSGLEDRAVGATEHSLLAALVGLAGLSPVLLAWQCLSPRHATAAGMTFDRLGAALTLLVAAVGAVTYRFSLRYLDGEPGQRRFLHWLAFAVGSAYAGPCYCVSRR